MIVLKKLALSAASVLLLSGTAAPFAAALPEETAPVWRTDVTGSRTERLPLISLVPGGAATSVRLTGLAKQQIFDFGLRADDVVSRAELQLAFTASASVLPKVSQLNVYLNGALQQSVPLTKETIGRSAGISIPLNSRQIESTNRLTLEFIGQVEGVCQNPAAETLWLDIGQGSRVVLTKERIRLANDLAKFPAPFVDTLSGAPTILPMVFAGTPSSTVKTAAAIAAGAVGERTAWRGADFPVYVNALPGEGHFIVFATNDARPDFLRDLPPAEGPEIRMADAPQSLADKMLIITGRDEADLVVAARTLAKKDSVMIGERVRVKETAVPEPRKAYDAPNWINTDVKLPLTSLASYPGQLSSAGHALPPVHLPLRLVPDLFMVSDAEVSLDVSYRASKPVPGETAQFRAFLNSRLIDSDNGVAADGSGRRQIQLPGYYGALEGTPDGTLALSALNDLSFIVGYERITEGGSPDNCKSVMLLTHRLEIEPVSTIEINGLYHHAVLPDLRRFTQSGWPFTKYADLSQTAVLTAPDAAPDEITTMLNTVARMSAVTGAAPLRVTVTDNPADPQAADKDLLIVGRLPTLITDIDKESAAALTKTVLDGVGAKKGAPRAPEGSVIAEGMTALVAGESPLKRGRSVVALLTEGPGAAEALNRRLVNPAELGAVTGGTAFVLPNETIGFAPAKTYAVGNLPWYHQVWMKLSDRPGWLAFAAILSAVMVGFAVFVFMRRWIGGRS